MLDIERFDKDLFLETILKDGSCIITNILPPDYIDRAKAELIYAIDQEVLYHGTSDYSDYGMVLLCSIYGGCFTELFDNPRLTEPFEAILGQGCIVYAYTSSSMPPALNQEARSNYSARIHVDCPRLIPNYITNLGATILLDDFTEENGATYYLPKSHNLDQQPSEEEFFKNAKRVIAPKGSVWFFNARTWHAGGFNSTSNWRHALTINMARPWMKQRIDIPRAMLGYPTDMSSVSNKALQKLGFMAQVPASYDEYYAPKEKRKFTQATE